MNIVIKPPFVSIDLARERVRIAEVFWNTRDPDRVASTFTEDVHWRTRTEIVEGRRSVVALLTRQWAREQECKRQDELWTFCEDRITTLFQSEWHDSSDHWFRSYGVELWEFAASGLIRRREASVNDLPIKASDRRLG